MVNISIKNIIESKINYQKLLLNKYENEINIIKKNLSKKTVRYYKKNKIKEIIRIVNEDQIIENIKKKNKNIIRFINLINHSCNLFQDYIEKYFIKDKLKKNIITLQYLIDFIKYAGIPLHIKISILQYKNIDINSNSNIHHKIKKIKYQLLRNN